MTLLIFSAIVDIFTLLNSNLFHHNTLDEEIPLQLSRSNPVHKSVPIQTHGFTSERSHDFEMFYICSSNSTELITFLMNGGMGLYRIIQI